VHSFTRGAGRHQRPRGQYADCKWVLQWRSAVGGQIRTVFTIVRLCGLSAVLIASFARAGQVATETLSSFTVEDGIEISSFGGPSLTRYSRGSATFSPDGRYFFFLTHRGLASTGAWESSLWLFSVETVRNYLLESAATTPPQPELLARQVAATNGARSTEPGVVIFEAQWAADGATIVFSAYNDDGNRDLYSVALANRRVRRISDEIQDVHAFAQRAGTLVYLAMPRQSEQAAWASAGRGIPDFTIGTGKSLLDLLYPLWQPNRNRYVAATIWVEKDGVRRQVQNPSGGDATCRPENILSPEPVLSPDGRYAVLQCYAEQVPDEWETYAVADPERSLQSDRKTAESGNSYDFDPFRPIQFILIDLLAGQQRALLDAPVAGWQRGYRSDPQAAWAPSGREVALSDSYLPLRLRNHGQEIGNKLLILRFPGNEIEFAMPYEVAKDRNTELWGSGIRWSPDGNAIVLSYEDRRERGVIVHEDTLRRSASGWTVSSSRSRQAAASHGREAVPLVVTVSQSMSSAPRLVASLPNHQTSKLLFDPNTQLQKIDLGVVSEFSWSDRFGRTLHGGLVRPSKVEVGKRYPLVIVGHGFTPDRFLSSVDVSGISLRALAARGIVALQIQEPSEHLGTSREAADDGWEVYRSAIDALVSGGLVNRDRVGLVGHSRTGAYAWEALVRNPTAFSAAAMDGGEQVGFYSYLMNVDYAGPSALADAKDWIGTEPFGNGLQDWVNSASGLNTDKIQTPVLFEEGLPAQMIYDWGNYAALRAQKKPAELIYFRTGDHPLKKAGDQLRSQEIHVDWFDFWLNEHEDPNPDKADQYQRWRNLRRANNEESAGGHGQ
jgi:hypothetical protein